MLQNWHVGILDARGLCTAFACIHASFVSGFSCVSLDFWFLLFVIANLYDVEDMALSLQLTFIVWDLDHFSEAAHNYKSCVYWR